MINVPIDRIVPLTDARDNFSKIVAEIENQKDGLYVLTKGGKPAIALVNIQHLSDIMGEGKADTLDKPKEEQPPRPEIKPVPEKPEAPKVDPVPEPKPVIPPTPSKPKIDPSWLGSSNQVTPTKPVNPWPLPTTSAAPGQERPAPMAAPSPKITFPSASNPGDGQTPFKPAENLPQSTQPPQPTPSSQTLPTPVTATPTPAHEVPLPPPPVAPPVVPVPRPTLPEVKIPVSTQPSSAPLPPPPANPVTIPFDEPSRTQVEPGEMPFPLKPEQTPVPAPSPQTPSGEPPKAPANQVSIQDIDI